MSKQNSIALLTMKSGKQYLISTKGIKNPASGKAKDGKPVERNVDIFEAIDLQRRHCVVVNELFRDGKPVVKGKLHFKLSEVESVEELNNADGDAD